MADKDLLEDAREQFKAASEAESEQRKASLDDLKFVKLSEQWDDAAITARRAEGRPCLTFNKLPSFVKQVVNDARMNRPQIKVRPIGDGASKDTAEVLNGLIRNIESQSRADIAYDTAIDFAVTMGLGYWIIRTDYTTDDSFDQDICIERVSNPFSVYGDPDSRDATSKDWNKAFYVDRMPKAKFKSKWKGAKAADFESTGDEKVDIWFEDEQVQVAEWWTRDEVAGELVQLSDGTVMKADEYLTNKPFFDSQGLTVNGTRAIKTHKVTQRIVSGVDILETNEWEGRFIPIVPVYGDEINVEGKRYFQSFIRLAKDAQRNYNYWRTASTELVALAPKAPFIGPVGAFVTDSHKWATANTKSHAYIEFDAVPGQAPPQRQPFAGIPAGALQEALNASDDMKAIIGIYDASLGARSNETSGRAIMARQREGDVSTFNYVDNLARAQEHTGAILVDLIPKIYTVPRIIRCVKPDGGTYEVPINQPTVPEAPAEPGMQPESFRQPGPDDQMQGMVKVFDLTSGKYDVSVSVGPSFTSKREESANQIMEFIRVFPQAAPLIGDILAKNLDWAGADEIAARLKAMLPPQARGQVDPMVQQLQGMLQQQDQMAKQAVGQLQEQIAQLNQQLQTKTLQEQAAKADTTVDMAKVDVDRMKIEVEAQKVAIERARLEQEQVKQQQESIQSAMVTRQALAPKVKRIQVSSPNGTYEGVMVRDKLEITAPSGQVYTGQVTGE